MPDEDDIQVEPVNGLPERPPEGERILWQGRPRTWALARESMWLYWIIGYFLILAMWRVGLALSTQPPAMALSYALPFLILGGIAAGVVLLIAFLQARATVYTVTSARVAMRVGAALTVTLNLPYTRIASADLDLRRDGTGTIAFTTQGETQLSYFVLWPHVRPWKMRVVQPALRAIPDAERIAALIAEAAETRVSTPTIASRAEHTGTVAAE